MEDINLKVGDKSSNGQVEIIAEDNLCYQVKSTSKGAVGLRTISKFLLKEFVDYFRSHPDSTGRDAKAALSGKSEVDKYEYGYNATLAVMAKMVLGQGLSQNEYVEDSVVEFIGPLQQIYYGAPGTGKSHTINEVTKKVSSDFVFRTTFHPDSDYSTFVGSYKPVMEEVETRVVPVVLNNGASFDQNNGTLKERKIGYKFVKQAFLKAYIAAWRAFTKNSNVTFTIQAPSPLSLTSGNQTWILKDVTDDKVIYTKEEIISVIGYEKDIRDYWGKMPEPDENGKFKLEPFDHYKATGCVWYRGQHGKEHSADECWEAIINVLKAGGVIEATPNSQTYSISLRGEDLVVVTHNNKANKGTIQGCYEKTDADSSVQKRIAKELKDNFDANDFDSAWDKLKIRVNGVEIPESTNTVEIPPVFLIIEEINRGNCAQIFGDLFQLLDRKEGFSQYPIYADEDIRKCLLSQHTDKDPSFGINGLELTHEQKALINSILDCEDDVAEKIACGEVLVLPPNLYIWATMNTSDQSLFPMDSAFKRRWDWEYVPIDYSKDIASGKFEIDIDGEKYLWVDFLKKVNEKIYDVTNSEDKQMGNFFIKKSVDAKEFVNKVMFYLWNEVCKEEYNTNRNFFRRGEEGKMEFKFVDLFEDGQNTILKEFMKSLNVEPIKNSRTEENAVE